MKITLDQSKINEDIGVTPTVISLQYAKASEISALLTSITDNISIDNTGNKLLVTASPKKIA